MARTAGLLILLGILCLPRELSFLFAGRGRPLHIGRPHWVLRAKGEQSEELVIGMACSATVTNLKKAGADLDLPGKKPGWIHIGQLQEGYTEKVEDVLSVGRQIEVRVMKVKEDQVEVTMRFSLPLFEKRLLPDYKEGDVLEGQVTSTTKRGVFLDIGAVVDGYLPESPESYSKGQMVKVAIKMIEVPRTFITLALV